MSNTILTEFALLKRVFFIFISFLLITACNNNQDDNSIPHVTDQILIDGDPNDVDWKRAKWRPMDQKWIGPDYSKEDFNGRYKVAWNSNHLYVLAETHDDVLMDIHQDGLFHYWDDDCLEVFIDEDASGGDHQYNYNAFAYHIGLDNKVVDIGVDSVPHYYNHINCVRKTEGNKSVWELSIDIYDDDFQLGGSNKKVKLESLKEIGFAIAYCDNDRSKKRENFIGSAVVEGEDKNQGWIDAGVFERFVLVR